MRGLQDLTEEEQEGGRSYLIKCLTTDEALKELEEKVRGPRKNSGRERERAKCGQLQATCSSGTSAHRPSSWPPDLRGAADGPSRSSPE